MNTSKEKPLSEIPCHLEIQVLPVHLATRLQPVDRDKTVTKHHSLVFKSGCPSSSITALVQLLQILSLCLNVCTVSVTMLQCVCNCRHGDQRSCPKQSLINILPSSKIQHLIQGCQHLSSWQTERPTQKWGEAIQSLYS